MVNTKYRTIEGGRVRLVDVARKAGVSRPAVARVLLGTGAGRVRVSKDTEAHVRRIAEAMQYRPNRAAQQLKGVKSGMIGVLLDTDNRAVMGDRLMAIERAAASRGMRLLVGWVQGDEDRLAHYCSDFKDRCVDGMIMLFDVTARHDRRLRRLIPSQSNVVYHGRPLRKGDKCVRVDTYLGVKMMVEHLLKQGHRRIGIELFNPNDRLMQLRREAYRDAMARAGMSIRTGLIWEGEGAGADPQPHHLEEAIRQLCVRGQIDALIASNDIWAVRFIQQLNQRGWRVPADLAVSGYDNLDISTVIIPHVTTIDQQHEAYAREALALLLDGEHGDPLRVIEPKLIIRDSTAGDIQVRLK